MSKQIFIDKIGMKIFLHDVPLPQSTKIVEYCERPAEGQFLDLQSPVTAKDVIFVREVYEQRMYKLGSKEKISVFYKRIK